MKNSVLFMAIPATLIAAFLFTNQPAQNSCAYKSTKDGCQRMYTGNYFAPDTLRLDPICNMKVDDKKGDTIHYKGHIFGFCSKYCRAEFVKDPEAYLPKKKN
ncbi:MAG: YHS domain-containing protein [Chitinophagaceae bacterium]|nr:YHS domain-containing protein [Chitinophagaceae bacterium]HQV59654.1 YHS domain-containing protein [Chitinophagaceae bacterium]HQV85612.1 YHS domain-containing protein [Chitinophagaceae bacterium]